MLCRAVFVIYLAGLASTTPTKTDITDLTDHGANRIETIAAEQDVTFRAKLHDNTRSDLLREKLDLVNERHRIEQNHESGKKWHDYGKKWAEYGAKWDWEMGNEQRNKREAMGGEERNYRDYYEKIGNDYRKHYEDYYGKMRDDYKKMSDDYENSWHERKPREEYGQRTDSSKQRDRRHAHDSESKWASVGQKWDNYGKKWEEYGAKWNSDGSKQRRDKRHAWDGVLYTSGYKSKHEDSERSKLTADKMKRSSNSLSSWDASGKRTAHDKNTVNQANWERNSNVGNVEPIPVWNSCPDRQMPDVIDGEIRCVDDDGSKGPGFRYNDPLNCPSGKLLVKIGQHNYCITKNK